MLFPGWILHGAGCVQQGRCSKHNEQLWSPQLPPGEGNLPAVWNGSANLEWLQTGSPETSSPRTAGDLSLSLLFFLFIFKLDSGLNWGVFVFLWHKWLANDRKELTVLECVEFFLSVVSKYLSPQRKLWLSWRIEQTLSSILNVELSLMCSRRHYGYYYRRLIYTCAKLHAWICSPASFPKTLGCCFYVSISK